MLLRNEGSYTRKKSKIKNLVIGQRNQEWNGLELSTLFFIELSIMDAIKTKSKENYLVRDTYSRVSYSFISHKNVLKMYKADWPWHSDYKATLPHCLNFQRFSL